MPPQIYLGQSDGSRSVEEVPSYSTVWASIAKPFAWFIFCLVAGAIAIPFLLIPLACVYDSCESKALAPILDWAKFVFPPVVGFGSAVVGYYFGTRSGNIEAPNASEADEDSDGVDVE
jgi:hypothetical protein